MIVEMNVPSPGESISEVEIATWLVAEGEYVEKEFPLDKTPLILFPCISTLTTSPLSTAVRNSENIIVLLPLILACGFLNIL